MFKNVKKTLKVIQVCQRSKITLRREPFGVEGNSQIVAASASATGGELLAGPGPGADDRHCGCFLPLYGEAVLEVEEQAFLTDDFHCLLDFVDSLYL